MFVLAVSNIRGCLAFNMSCHSSRTSRCRVWCVTGFVASASPASRRWHGWSPSATHCTTSSMVWPSVRLLPCQYWPGSVRPPPLSVRSFPMSWVSEKYRKLIHHFYHFVQDFKNVFCQPQIFFSNCLPWSKWHTFIFSPWKKPSQASAFERNFGYSFHFFYLFSVVQLRKLSRLQERPLCITKTV